MVVEDLQNLQAGVELEQLMGTALFVIPVSAVEQHGPHLPVSTDALIIEALKQRVSAEVANSMDLVWLPHLMYGSSEEHLGTAGTVSLRPETLLAVLGDLCRSLAVAGVRRVAFMNGHGGNAPLLQVAARQARARHDMYCTLIRPLAHLSGKVEDVLDMHAGCAETAIMLSLRPEMVARDRIPNAEEMSRAHTAMATQLAQQGGPQLGWISTDLSANGVIGLPHAATAEQGNALMEQMVSRTIVELEQASQIGEVNDN